MIDSNHERFEELAAGYALDALDIEERREFEAHVDGCPRCTEVLVGLVAAASHLPMGVPQHEAPASLRERVMGAIRAEPNAASPRVRRSWSPSQSNPVRYAMAAGVAALLVASAWSFMWVLDLRDDNAAQERLLARSYEALSLMAAAEQRWDIVGTAASVGARGIVAYDEDTGRSSIIVWGLDENPEMQYNVWVRKDAQRTRVARLYAADGGFWAVVQDDVLVVDGLDVTQVTADGQATVVIDFALPSK
ncbi:MAG: zf-HC2 domain-containing protein [Chloroflexi bacterium]|nr:zf-HC2 domain-containing protein [Chloroflexota bacterium]